MIEPLVAKHSIFHSRSLIGYAEFSDEERAELPPVPQTVVRVHPGSRRRTLYIASHASHIVGWPVEKGRALLKDLIDFSTQPRFVYQHRWCGGDLVAWDDRCTLHRARPTTIPVTAAICGARRSPTQRRHCNRRVLTKPSRLTLDAPSIACNSGGNAHDVATAPYYDLRDLDFFARSLRG